MKIEQAKIAAVAVDFDLFPVKLRIARLSNVNDRVVV
jgi:hypothetical protein